MFDAHIFRSWPEVLLGATGFAALFMIIGMMEALLFDGVFHLTRAAALLGGGAFAGYVAVAWLTRYIDQKNAP